MELPLATALGLALSSGIAWAAYRKESLSPSGLYAAAIIGTLIFSLGGWRHWAIMILFFLSSSLLSKINHNTKSSVATDFAKTGQRDWLQVLANSSIGLAYALAWQTSGEALFSIGYIAAFATVNADTWATEIGVLSSKPPVSILTFKPSSPGVSGAVSALGTTAALAGAAFIGLAAMALQLTSPNKSNLFVLFLAATTGGMAGCIMDSVFGATVQALYRCCICGKLTELTDHHNQPTEMIRGLKFFNNDMVNFSSSLLGSLLALGVYYLLT